MSNKRISVIIRSKNEEKWLASCLYAVRNQNYSDIEIIVVDNESIDNTVAIAKKYDAVLVKISDEEFNYSYALNKGIQVATGDFIAILSGHCIPVNEWWLNTLKANFDCSDIAGVYGRQEPMSDSSPFDKRDLWMTFGLDRKVQVKDFFFHNANSMILKEIWKKLPFNTDINGLEDRGWAKRILELGYKIVYEPYASVYHHHGLHHSGSVKRVERVVKVLESIQKDLI